MRLKLCHFSSKLSEHIDGNFSEPLEQIILNINDDPLQEILDFWPKFGSLKFISRDEL